MLTWHEAVAGRYDPPGRRWMLRRECIATAQILITPLTDAPHALRFRQAPWRRQGETKDRAAIASVLRQILPP